MGIVEKVKELTSSFEFVGQSVQQHTVFIEILVRVIGRSEEIHNAPIAGLPSQILDD